MNPFLNQDIDYESYKVWRQWWRRSLFALAKKGAMDAQNENSWEKWHRITPPVDEQIRDENGGLILSGEGDGEKKIFNGDSTALHSPGCIIYSLGSHGMIGYELSMLKLSSCDIFAFDCFTLPTPEVMAAQDKRLKFFDICIGDKIKDNPKFMPIQDVQKMLHHDRIDLLKMDIEGSEIPVIRSWYNAWSIDPVHYNNLPMQVSFEGHWTNVDEILEMINQLVEMGYVWVARTPNIYCGSPCYEMVISRVVCNNSVT